MFAFFDPALIEAIGRWEDLKRWERRELAERLRRLALSYAEIGQLIPVGKGTLSAWCRDLVLTDDEQQLLRQRQRGLIEQGQLGRSRRYRTVELSTARRVAARLEVSRYSDDPFWAAGVSAYWAEGGKRWNRLAFANSDADLVCLFIEWAKRFLCLTPDRFTIALHVHDGQDEAALRDFWSKRTGLKPEQFRKTFIKPEGSGHRKNRIYNGTAQVRVTKSSALLDRVLGWIDGLRDVLLASG
jgi:hypothetical protein